MPKGRRGENGPADAIGLAVMISKIATGEIEDERVVILDSQGKPLVDAAGELIVLTSREEAERWLTNGERVEPYIPRRHSLTVTDRPSWGAGPARERTGDRAFARPAGDRSHTRGISPALPMQIRLGGLVPGQQKIMLPVGKGH